MKTKYLLFLILAVSLLVLTACEEEAAKPVAQGLVVEFIPISVMEEGIYSIYDDEEFPLEIILKNQGEEALKAGDVKLTLLGPSKEDFSGIAWEKENTNDIEKVSEFNPEGGEETIEFADKAKYLKEVHNFLDVTWNVDYQYKYKTYLVIDDICFKEDLKDPRVCTVKEPKTFSVSQAPVTITSVKEDTAGKGVIVLTIEVKNAGGGDITLVGEEFDNRFDQFAFEIDNPDKWECSCRGKENLGKIYKNEDSTTIRCKLKQPLEEGELYTTPVKMTFEYLYENLIKETLRIKESAE